MVNTQGISFAITAQNKTDKVFSSIKTSVASLTKSFAKMGPLAVAAAGGAATAAFAAMGKTAMDTGDKIHKLSIRLGASAEALSQYRHVADMSGVSFDTLVMGFQRMTRRVAEAANGSGEAKGALEELGIAAEELNQLAPEQQFERLTDALMAIESPADRVRLAMKLFDSEGVSLLQMMNGGSEGLRQMREEADALGMTMNKEMVTGIANANDSIQKVSSRISAMVEQIMGSLAPAITDIADELGGWIDQNRELISQQMTDVLKSLAESAKIIAPIMADVAGAIQSVGQALGWAMFKGWEFLKWTEQLQGKYDFMGAGEVNPGGTRAIVNQDRAAALTGAAAVAASGGGEAFGDDSWINSRGAVVNNFNMQISRSDAVAIASETARQAGRQ